MFLTMFSKKLNIVVTMHIGDVFHDNFWKHKEIHEGTKKYMSTKSTSAPNATSVLVKIFI